MSKLLDALNEYLKTLPFKIIRFSEADADGNTETLICTDASSCQNCYSVAKTFTMTAIGILYDKGLLKPEDKICDILRDEIPDGIDPRWYENTIDRALTHRLGLPEGFLDIDCNRSTDFTDDYLRYLFLYPLACTPGTKKTYSDGAFYLLSCIVEKISGMSLDNFLWKELFVHMEYQEMAWSHCPKGHAMGATGLYLSSDDIVKLGVLYVNNGVYKGKRLLSEEWVKLVLDRSYALNPDETGKVYSKGGMFGQILFIIPSEKKAYALQSFGANADMIMNFVRDFKG